MSGEAWINRFPDFKQMPAETQQDLLRAGRVISVPAGTVLFSPGQAPAGYIVVLSGTVRVQQMSETGREIVLYRVATGETCALTTTCLLGHEDYAAEAVAETDVDAVAIPRAAFDSLIASSAAFRHFVFTAFSQRVTNLFKLIEEVAFSRIDVRLAQRLLELSDATGRVQLTHQQLASELGTAREVVSRQLHEFQRRGWLTTARGALSISEPAELQKLAHSR